jgi:hypothetical protein
MTPAVYSSNLLSIDFGGVKVAEFQYIKYISKTVVYFRMCKNDRLPFVNNDIEVRVKKIIVYIFLNDVSICNIYFEPLFLI